MNFVAAFSIPAYTGEMAEQGVTNRIEEATLPSMRSYRTAFIYSRLMTEQQNKILGLYKPNQGIFAGILGSCIEAQNKPNSGLAEGKPCIYVSGRCHTSMVTQEGPNARSL